jgi:hypothetical protein
MSRHRTKRVVHGSQAHQPLLLPRFLRLEAQLFEVHAVCDLLLQLLMPHKALREVGVTERVTVVGVSCVHRLRPLRAPSHASHPHFKLISTKATPFALSALRLRKTALAARDGGAERGRYAKEKSVGA